MTFSWWDKRKPRIYLRIPLQSGGIEYMILHCRWYCIKLFASVSEIPNELQCFRMASMNRGRANSPEFYPHPNGLPTQLEKLWVAGEDFLPVWKIQKGNKRHPEKQYHITQARVVDTARHLHLKHPLWLEEIRKTRAAPRQLCQSHRTKVGMPICNAEENWAACAARGTTLYVQ